MEQINLDLIPGKVKPVCHASQYDIGRIIRLNLYMDGLPYTLTGVETISLMLRKSNFVVIIEEVTNTSSSYVEIETTENTCDVSGEYECELRVEDDEINIGSANFKMVVEPDAFDGQLATGTASGRIASFYTSLEEDLVENKIAFSATQDLHGQSAPYPAGGGKNKFAVPESTSTVYGVTLTRNSDGSITLNGLCSSAGNFVVKYTLPAGTYTLSCPYSGTLPNNGAARAQLYNAAESLLVTIVNSDPSSQARSITIDHSVVFDCRIRIDQGFNYQSVILYPQLEVGENATSFAPYSNICPIVGVDKVNFTRTGKNLFNPAISNYINTSIKFWGVNDNNIVTFLNTLKEGTYKLSYKIKVDAINGSGTDQYGIIIANSQSGQVSTRATESNVSVGSVFTREATITVTASNKGLFANCWFYTGRSPNTNADNCTFYDMQLELGSTATTYEPYNGTTAVIDFGGTYYGGTLDVLTGKIILTHKIFTLETRTGYQTSSNHNYKLNVISDCLNVAGTRANDMTIEVLAYNSPLGNYFCYYHIYNYCIVGVPDNYTIEEYNQNIAGTKLVYPLATPIIIDLTEENIYEVSGSTAQFEAHISKPMKTIETNFVSSQASGTPTPSAPIPIVGVDKVNVVRCGKNQLAKPFIYYSSASTNLSDYFFVKAGTYRFSFGTSTADNWRFVIRMKDASGNNLSSNDYKPNNGLNWNNTTEGWLHATNVTSTTMQLTFATDCFIRILFGYGNTSASSTFTNAQLEVGSTATTYEPYNGTTALINLGDTYYGGSVDAVTGKITLTHKSIIIDGSQTITVAVQAYIKSDACDCFITVNDIYPRVSPPNQPDDFAMCDKLSPVKQMMWNLMGYPNCMTINQNQIHLNIANDLLGITDYTQETTGTAKAKIQTFLQNNPIEVIYGFEPIAIYASNTAEIPTIVGKNIVFTDAGDVRVEYYDAPAPNPIYITTLNGENNIYSDTNGDITVKYYKNIND